MCRPIYKSTKFNNHWTHGDKNNKVSISSGYHNHKASFMMASWNWSTFRIAGLCKRNLSVESTHKWPVMRTFDGNWQDWTNKRQESVKKQKTSPYCHIVPLMFPLTLGRTNCYTNGRVASGLRRHMLICCSYNKLGYLKCSFNSSITFEG